MKKFGIVIPTLNRKDLFKGLWEDLSQSGIIEKAELVIVVDNGDQDLRHIISQDYDNVSVYIHSYNMGVAASWNLGILDMLDQVDGVFILNDDIRWQPSIEDLGKFLTEQEEALYKSSRHWCNVYIPAKVYEKIGLFDENFFPAYFEDNDYSYRAKLLNIPIKKSKFLDPTIYRNSSTIAKDPGINKSFEQLKQYYIEKWGGEPGHEIYSYPENGDLNGWAISKELFEKMKEVIPVGEHLLEFGSGAGTPMLHHYWKTVSIEHDLRWVEKLVGKFKHLLVPIKHNSWGKTYNLTSYQVEIISGFRYVLIDGPPSDRRGLMEYEDIFRHSKVIIVDDTHRSNERELSKMIADRYRPTEIIPVNSHEKEAHILCF